MKSKSIASVLHKILFVGRILMMIMIAALGVAIIALTFGLIFGDQVNEIPGVHIETDFDGDSHLGDLLEVVGVAVGFVIAYQVISRLIEILRSITREQPFERENADRLSRIAKALVVGQIIGIFLAITGVIVDADIDFKIDLSLLLGAAIAAVLAEVFREGARLREEQEFTV